MKIKTGLLKITNSASLKSGALLLVFAFTAFALPPNEFAAFAKTAASANNTEDENFDKKFREGRDLIDKQEWKKASEKFSEVINQYPDNKSVDAALYWLAFCYKKQREFEKMGAAVDRLVKDHPSSSWTSDARVLLIEVVQPAKVVYGAAGQNIGVFTEQDKNITIAKAYSTNKALKPGQPLATTSIGNVFDSYIALNGFYSGTTKTPLDRADEIKIAAFQSLLAADHRKAFQAMNDILKADSKNSEGLKIEVLRALRRPRTFEGVTPLQSTPGTLSPSVKNQYVSDIREPLFKLVRGEKNTRVRTEMIYTLANLKDDQATNYLSQLYDSESDKELKKTIINGLGSYWGAFNGIYAIDTTPFKSSSGSLSGQSFSMTIGQEKGEASRKPEFVKLLDIVKTEKEPELRRLALTNIQRFSGWQKNAQMVDVLSGIYDSETNEDFKKSIIQSLSRFDQPQAAKKLLDIAKSDKSDKLKLEAIYALGKSKDPAALDYLQQVLQ